MFYLIIPQVTYTENQHHTKPVSQISPINPAHGDLEPNPKFKTVPLKKSSEQKCQPIEQPHRNTPLAQMKLPTALGHFSIIWFDEEETINYPIVASPSLPPKLSPFLLKTTQK